MYMYKSSMFQMAGVEGGVVGVGCDYALDKAELIETAACFHVHFLC